MNDNQHSPDQVTTDQGTTDHRAVDVVVHGRVQGVSFRDATRRRAEELGVRGWVRNRPDGTVAAHFAGSPSAVTAIVQWCHHGPSAAVVDSVEVNPAGSDEEPAGFEIR